MCLTPCSPETVTGTPIFLVTNEKLRRVAALQRLPPGVAQVTRSQPETCNAKPSRLTLAHSLAHIFQRELDLAREDGRQHTAQGEARRARNPGDSTTNRESISPEQSCEPWRVHLAGTVLRAVASRWLISHFHSHQSARYGSQYCTGNKRSLRLAVLSRKASPS